MDELIAVVPLALAAISLIGTIFNLTVKARAERKFVDALNNELKKKLVAKIHLRVQSGVLNEQGESLGNNDPALVRSLYREALKSSSVSNEASNIVALALNDLASKDKKYIKMTLQNNTVSGRARYLGKVFRKAADLAVKHVV